MTLDRVIFRKFKGGEGDYPAATVPAMLAEYAPLMQELHGLGYNLRVVKRLAYRYPSYPEL